MLNEAEQIVWSLAERGAPLWRIKSRQWECMLCHQESERMTFPLADHSPVCVFRRSIEWLGSNDRTKSP